jgi:hypothetical protein
MKCSKCTQNNDFVIAKLTDKNGEQLYCLNCLMVASINRKLCLTDNPLFVDDVTGEAGAVKYENHDEIYFLSVDRMMRLITHNLSPEEYFALAKKYGADKFLLHSDFYDAFDGEALQPAGLY